MLKEEKKGTSTAILAAASSSNSVDVVIGIIRRVILNDPVDLWEIKSSLGDISAEEDTCFGLAELKVGACPLLLLLLSVDVLHGDVHVVE